MKASFLTNNYFFIFLLLISSCKNEIKQPDETVVISALESESQFVETMQKHLAAVTNKDLVALESTLSPEGTMQLILPGTEITNTVKDFMDYHKAWFAIDNGWTFETKILNTQIGETIGMAIVQIIYHEPERDGMPYFNRMIVSYDLKKINDKWYVIKDHASSVEKSTDK